MELQVIPLDFLGQGAMLTPADPELFELVKQYCKENLKDGIPNFSKLAKTWCVAELDENGKAIAVHGVAGTVLKPDIPLFRCTKGGAVKKLKDRINDYYADQGYRGGEAFIYISDSEPEESRCPQWADWLKAFGAKPAERYIVVCK